MRIHVSWQEPAPFEVDNRSTCRHGCRLCTHALNVGASNHDGGVVCNFGRDPIDQIRVRENKDRFVALGPARGADQQGECCQEKEQKDFLPHVSFANPNRRLPAGLLADDTARKRFRKEALALSKLSRSSCSSWGRDRLRPFRRRQASPLCDSGRESGQSSEGYRLSALILGLPRRRVNGTAVPPS